MINIKNPFLNILKLATLIFISSCGGGGGGGGSSTPATNNTSTTFDPNNFVVDPQWDTDNSIPNPYETTEYNAQWGLNKINAAAAYLILDNNSKSNGGQGVTISVIDSGALINHQEIFANYDKTDNDNNGDYDNDYDFYNSDNDPTDDRGHGTHVASTALGVKDDNGMHGVAFNSTLVAFKALGSNGLGSDSNIADSINSSILSGTKVINLSLGGTLSSGLIKNALLNAKSADIITIAANGNDGANQPNYPAYSSIESDLQGYILAVGSIDENSNISTFSNYCGDTKDYCLVAPGENIMGAYYTGNSNYALYSGTSMATPHVAGAAALIRAAWPHLTAPQTAQILLQTATDLGETGTDNIYGRGLLNLEFAVQAQGQNALNYGTSSNSGGYELKETSIVTDPIFGDAFAKNISPKINSAIFLDDFGRDYKSFLGTKINFKNSSQVNAENILFNNISFNLTPLKINKNSQFNFQIPNFKNKESNNLLGLKFITNDNSKENHINYNQGFSFNQKTNFKNKKINFGFSLNIDEYANSKLSSEINDFNSLKARNIYANNPFQSFFQSQSSSLTNLSNYRFFKQAFINNKFLDENLNFSFLYQDSYDSNQIYSNVTKKQNQILNFGIDYELNKKNKFSIQLGKLTEFDNNILNSKSYGAFESPEDTKTSFLKLSLYRKLFENINLIISYSEGLTNISGNSLGVFRNYSKIQSRSFESLLAFNIDKTSKFGFAYTQPLRVYKGYVNYDIPIARDIDGNIYRSSGTASLVPNGKEENFEIFYQNQISKNSKITANFLIQKEAGNIKDNSLNYLSLIIFNKNF